MDTFRQWLYLGPGKLELQTVNKVEPEGNLVRIKVKAFSICGSDLLAYKAPHARMVPPLVLGHEFCGVVDAIGSEVSKFKPGDRVVINPVLYCGKCFHCQNGMENMCPNRRNTGGTVFAGRWDGCMREYTYTPEYSLIALPEEVSFVEGALIEPLSVSLNSSGQHWLPNEETAVVSGLGPIGMGVLYWLKDRGVKRVICSDVLERRREIAKDFGADVVIDPRKENLLELVQKMTPERGGADRVFICCEVPTLFNDAIPMCRMGGTIVLVGHIRDDVHFKPTLINGRGLNVTTNITFHNDQIEKVIDTIQHKRIDLSKIITSVMPFEDTQKAFEILAKPNNEMKIVIKV